MVVAEYRSVAERDVEEYPRKPPALGIEFVMLGLAVASVVLLVWITFFPVSGATERAVVIADYAICAVFAAEFLWRWRRADWSWTFPLVYWYEVLGMIPVTSPFFRGFRLLRIVVIGVRLARVADRAFGDRVTAAVVNRFLGEVVEAVKRPVTIAVMDEVARVMRTGHYTRNIALALEENRDELDAMIVELIRNDPQIGRVRYLPFHEDVIRGIANTSFRILFQALADPRIDELIGDVLRENVNQMRIAVRDGVRVSETVDHKVVRPVDQ
ncbi:ion transporter [Nocardia sp. CDC159]|uniref:Ion transporter n=1 Tax=Nocardia pulmonis TaxID=2951408 RepID=A0A9X2IUA6_9NOCA|nr:MULTISPECIES: ion transporter [Nocardia]MCM6772672.1 ion transporter [Nocardia pulmonis]MCM6786025.1 ion transporter [Nocardia sp. CDC159]